jgi:predicted phosphodiesterase
MIRKEKIILPILVFMLIICQASAQTKFAIIGDYGDDDLDEELVANLVNSWNVDFIITTGDNSYDSNPIDDNIGKYYSDWIGNYNGSYGNGSTVNKFFPSLGNHDYGDGGGINAYLNYFTLPGISGNSSGNERYFDYIIDNIHFFAINSNDEEPDGVNGSSVQANWLQNEMTSSSAGWKIVYFHHPPYSSGQHGNSSFMRWNFLQWGADAVISGHDHNYERLEVDSLIYFVNGLGGRNIRNFGSTNSHSMFRYNGDFGAQKVTVNGNEMTFEFYNINSELIDSWTIQQSTPDTTPPSLLAAEINNPAQVTLFFSESLDAQSAQDESNYSINNGISVISAILNGNNRDVTLTTSEHTITQQYTATVSNVTDLAGNIINPEANSAQYLFEADTTSPEILNATILDSVTLKISFSELLESSTAQNPNNYSITNGISVFSASLSGSEVILNTSTHSPGIYTVTVNNVTDLAGNIISPLANTAQYEFVQDPQTELIQLQIVNATASVTPEPDHSPDKAIDGLVYGDGDPDSRWAGDTMPEWLMFDLGTIQNVSLSKLSFYAWNDGRIYNYSISVSNDMNQWTEVVSPSLSSSDEWTINEFQPINTRYVKIDYISSNQGTWAGLWEGELWGYAPNSVGIEGTIPDGFTLEQNYPNPFNPSTKIRFTISDSRYSILKVYDLLGNEVATLVNEEKPPGTYEAEFNAENLSSGIYFYQLTAGAFSEKKKMILLK